MKSPFMLAYGEIIAADTPPESRAGTSAGMAHESGAMQGVPPLAAGSEIESALEACRGWLAMQTTREGCLTTAGDIIDDLRFFTDSPERFRAAVFPNNKDDTDGRSP